MPGKPFDLPPESARAFVKDLRAFFAAGGTGAKADEIAARQAVLLGRHLGKRSKELKVQDVKEMFFAMKDDYSSKQ
jgi:hypothetical protein